MQESDFFKRYIYDSENDNIGGGAFGEVYKAYDTIEDRYVAIKVSKRVTLSGKTFSLQDEFEATTRLKPHVNIAKYEQLYTFKTPQGVFDYAIMQYYPQGNLKKFLQEEPLNSDEREDLVMQLLEGISFLHENQIIHRDLKPANILISKRNVGEKTIYILKIADFGLSKVAKPDNQTRMSNSFGGGTLEYSSPEQLTGKPLRFNTDLWAFGVIAYEALTGKSLSFLRDTKNNLLSEQKTISNILNKDIAQDLKILPQKWQNALNACLKKEPEIRVKTSNEIRSFLDCEEKDIKSSFHNFNQIETQVINNPVQPQIIKEEKRKILTKGKAMLFTVVTLTVVIAYLLTRNDGTAEAADEEEEMTTVNLDSIALKNEDRILRERYFKDYDYVDFFSEGFARVAQNGKEGFINKEGKVVIPLIYDNVSYFSEGLALVLQDGKQSFINKEGKVAINLMYDETSDFSDGLATVSYEGKCGFINKEGKVVIPLMFEFADFFSNGLAPVILNGKSGFINKYGKVVISLPYEHIWNFSDGLALVKSSNGYGFINKDGKLVIPLVYDSGSHFSEGLAHVSQNDKYGYINKKGQLTIPLIYNYTWSFNEGLAHVTRNGKDGFINKEGIVVIPLIYDEASDFSDGLALVKHKGKYGFIDKKGNVAIPTIYDHATVFFEGVASVDLNGKELFINAKGECISKNCP